VWNLAASQPIEEIHGDGNDLQSHKAAAGLAAISESFC